MFHKLAKFMITNIFWMIILDLKLIINQVKYYYLVINIECWNYNGNQINS